MLWRLLIFRARHYRRLLLRLALILVAVVLIAAISSYASNQRRYRLTVNIQAPFVGEGVEVYVGCCHIVDQGAGDRRTFIFVLPRGDYNVGGMLAQNGEYRPLPTHLVPVHLDRDTTITLHPSSSASCAASGSPVASVPITWLSGAVT